MSLATNGLDRRVGRRQYLVTYSQADEKIFPTRQSFGDMVSREFNVGPSAAKVDYWACCREEHQQRGFHYHCSIKLTGCKKWVSVRNRIALTHGIQINFSDSHDFYLSAYRYVCKQDQQVTHSTNHPEGLLSANSPKTKKSIAGFRASCAAKKNSNSESTEASAPKKPCKGGLKNFEVSEFIRERGIKSYLELLAVTEERRTAGQMDFANFLFSRSEKFIRELISKTWQMSTAKAKLEEKKMSRIDKMQSMLTSDCVEDCGGRWLECAREVLELNRINISKYISSVRDLLTKGRGKHRNIILIGPANCAKTFMLKPLKTIFGESVFENPAHDKFAWVGAESAKVFLLNDFRWSKEIIPWHDFLLLLEGETVKLPAPKNLYSEDIKIESDVAIFATSKSEIKFKGSYNASDDRETEMMAARWNVFKLKHQFSPDEQKNVPACSKCFSTFILTE